MKVLNQVECAHTGSYEAPQLTIFAISVERGFEASDEFGIDGPTYDEEDVIW